MSGSGYWDSLKHTGIILYILFFCLFAGLAVFIFLYDIISALEIWNSPVWIKIKVPIIILSVISFLAAIILFSRYEGRKELQKAQEFARSQGWDFSHHDTIGLKARAAEILSTFRNIYLYFIRTVETKDRRLYLFNCSYNYEKDTTSKSSSYGLACMIESDKFRSVAAPVEIISRDWTEIMISDKIDMGEDTPFAQHFLVLSKDPASAKETINENIQAVVLEHKSNPLDNPVGITIGPGGVVVMTDRTNEPERIYDIIDLARRIETAME